MRYYANIKQKLADKLKYVEKIKAERNDAQDTLKEVYTALGVDEAAGKEKLLQTLHKLIDVQE